MQHTIQKMKENCPSPKITFPTLQGSIFIRWEEISYFKSNDNYCMLVDTGGESHFVAKSLKWVESKLDDYCFYRIHKSYFINIQAITQYKRKGTGCLRMECGNEIPISKAKKSDVMLLIESGGV